MFKVSVAFLLMLRSCTASVEAKSASKTRGRAEVTFSHVGDGCSYSWYDGKWQRVCDPPIISRQNTGRHATSTASVSPQNAQTKAQSKSVVNTTSQGKNEDKNSGSTGPNEHVPSLTSIPSVGQKDESLSGSRVRAENQKPPGMPSSAEQSGAADARGDQMSESEQRSRGSGYGEGRDLGEVVPTPEVVRESERDLTRPLVQRVLSVTETENTQEMTKNDLNDQEFGGDSMQGQRSTTFKRHAIILTATLNLICV